MNDPHPSPPLRPVRVLSWLVSSLLVTSPTLCSATTDPSAPHSAPSKPKSPPAQSLNPRVIQAIDRMPAGGGYAVTREASLNLSKAIQTETSPTLSLDPKAAQPSYCSGATYLVLLAALQPHIDSIPDPQKRANLVRRLRVEGQSDGVGLWGRWNSNGPCMAVWFAESGLGRSFWDYESAQPGDFLKLWWTDSMGRDEAGHSVVFLRYTATPEGDPGLEFWSSNKPLGYGKKVVPFTKVRHALFSRCEHPERVLQLLDLPERNDFLASMLKRNTTENEINRKISTR